MPRGTLDSFSAQLIKDINNMPSLAQTFKTVSYSSTLTNKNTKLLETLC